jgi:predicted Zn-dependent peptidase
MTNVKLADIRQHYKKTHSTSNLRFVIGGILPSDRRTQLEEMLESLPLPKGTGRIDLPRERPINLEHSLYIDNDTVQNLYFSIDTYIPRKLLTKELDALQMLSILLTETYYSRILGSAREQGLIYHIGQSRSALEWSLGGQVSQDNAEALFDLISNELSIVKKGGIKSEEVETAKQYALGRYQRSAQTVAGTTNGYSYRYFFDEVIEDYYKIPERIEKITKNDTVDVTKELFARNIWAMGGLGSCGGDFLEQLRQKVSQLW